MNRTLFQKGAATQLVYPLQEAPADPGDLIDPQRGISGFTSRPIYPYENGFNNQKKLFSICRESVTQNLWPEEYVEATCPHDANIRRQAMEFYVEEFARHTPLVRPESLAKDCAQLVQMDDPEDLGNFLFKWLWMKLQLLGTKWLERKNAWIDYLGEHLTKAYKHAFASKYYWGLARPEEHYDLPGCVITEYRSGCPTHPSYPAGHGTFAGVTAEAIIRFFNLDPEGELAQVVRCIAWLFAHFRTFAGVHWAQDNDAGLDVGAKVHEHYGIDLAEAA